MFGKFLNAPFTKWSEIHFHQAFFQLSIGTNWARLYILTLVIPKSFGNLKMLYAYILYVASLFNFDCNCHVDIVCNRGLFHRFETKKEAANITCVC